MKKIEIVLPCYNEEKILENNVLKIFNFLKKSGLENWQITIAENGSSDKTLGIAKKIASNYPNIKTLNTERGRGNAIKRAWLESNADIMLYMDIDLSTKPEEIPKLVKTLEETDIAIGSRVLKESNCKRSFFRKFISWIYNKIVQKIFNIKISDTQCGFKGINQKVKESLRTVENDDWFFDTELIVKASKEGLKIKEIPISWNERGEQNRNSKVKIIPDSINFLINIWQLKKRLSKK